MKTENFNLLTYERLNDLLYIDVEKGVFIWNTNKGGKGKKIKRLEL